MTRAVAFVCINGTGMGHATRILAIARRLPSDITPVIVSNSPALDAFQMLPNVVIEHVPGIDYLDVSYQTWSSQLKREFGAILDLYDCDVVVQDGTALFPWVRDSVIENDRGRRLVWIRRPMWRERREVYRNFKEQAWCDLVIEPGEYAEAVDDGPTTRALTLAPSPARFVKTGPIRLLDGEEALSARDARKRLGIADGEKAVLVQLGAGTLRRNWDAAAAAVDALRRRGGHRIFLARWKISGDQPDHGADVTVLDTYPLARFFAAFDFHVAAAGYNSFHEIMAAGQRAVFVPNYMEVDDQTKRALFAEQQGRGIVVASRPEATLHARMQAAIQSMTDEQPVQTSPLDDNGAERAAAEIAALCQG